MAEQDKKCILQVKNLHVHYITDEEEVYAVNGISFDLNEGDSIGLVGETGAGKTTTALAIMQLVPDPPGVITEGEIYFKGKNMILNTDAENQKIRGNGISMIFQDPMTALNPTMTVGDQLIEVLRRHKKRLSFNQKAASQMIRQAVASLAENKALHDELESIYLQAMDFSMMDSVLESVVAQIVDFRTAREGSLLI